MYRVQLLSVPRWLWWILLAVALLASPLFLLHGQDPSGLATRLIPAYLEQTVVYDKDGNVLDITTVKAVGDPVSLTSLQKCVEETRQKTQLQSDQAFQTGATEFKGQFTCR